MADTYNTVVLAQRPKGEIVPGETFRFQTEKRPTQADLKDGQVVVETRYLSLDPAMRGWLNDVRSYVPPVPIGGVMRGAIIGKVIASKSNKFPVGKYVSASIGWAELGIADEKTLQPIELPKHARLTDTLGCLGMTGLTAYFGILEVAQVKAGDFVVVSGAAGATGSVVCQIAKIKGATVLGLAGSDDKVEWLKELGCDHALNYRHPQFAKNFREQTKGFIDVFFDNVGGEVLDLALSRAKPHARFAICGAISTYNTRENPGPKNFNMIISMRIRVQGFIIFDYAARFAAARAELAQWLAEGKLQRKETILMGGLGAAEQGLCDLYKGVNTGKLLVEIKAGDGEMGSKL